MNGREAIFLYHTLGDEDGILIVVTIPRHESDQHVLPQGQLTHVGGRTIGQYIAACNHITNLDQRSLVNAGVLVGACVFG